MSISETLKGPEMPARVEDFEGQSIKNSQTKTKSQVVVVGWLNTTQKEAIAEPPVPPLGAALRARLESQVPGIGQGKCCIARSGRYVLRTEPLPSLPTSSGFLQEMETFKMDEDKALGYMAAV